MKQNLALKEMVVVDHAINLKKYFKTIMCS